MESLSPPATKAFAGAETCASCHEDHYLPWKEGGHCQVSCETCHGPAGDHIRLDVDPRPFMNLPGDAENCLACHGGSSGTVKNEIPQVESLEKHVEFIGKKHSVKTDIQKTRGRCIFCHDPHSLE
ncbi:MAG: hypothetical protein KJ645_11250 [Planctomycetes bacterium]|nr:hypothetical protein [Planctomycetota bacterium]